MNYWRVSTCITAPQGNRQVVPSPPKKTSTAGFYGKGSLAFLYPFTTKCESLITTVQFAFLNFTKCSPTTGPLQQPPSLSPGCMRFCHAAQE